MKLFLKSTADCAGFASNTISSIVMIDWGMDILDVYPAGKEGRTGIMIKPTSYRNRKTQNWEKRRNPK